MDKRIQGIVSMAIAVAVTGCSQLKVHKITPQQRACQIDHETPGFRYYLSRPYILVKNRVLVSTNETLMIVDPAHLQDGMEGEVFKQLFDQRTTSLNTQAAFEALARAYPQRVDDSTGKLVPVSHAELEDMRQFLVASLAAADIENPDRENPAGRVQLTSAEIIDTLPSAYLSDTAATGAASNTEVVAPAPAAAGQQSSASAGDFEIVFLPDLDEQYAVEHKNCLAESDFKLRFKDGWQLTGVSSDVDNTQVALEVLNTIDTAIESAKSLSVAGIDRQARALEAAADNSNPNALASDKAKSFLIPIKIVQKTYIDPGMYRIQKPWEAGGQQMGGSGLLTQLGLPQTVEVSIEKLEEPKTTKTK